MNNVNQFECVELDDINEQLEEARKKLDEKREALDQWYDIDSRREGGSIRQDLIHENRKDNLVQSIREQESNISELEHLQAQLELKKLTDDQKEDLKPEVPEPEPEVDDKEKLKESAV
jgi:uncharacterized protein (DUF3084 family)